MVMPPENVFSALVRFSAVSAEYKSASILPSPVILPLRVWV